MKKAQEDERENDKTRSASVSEYYTLNDRCKAFDKFQALLEDVPEREIIAFLQNICVFSTNYRQHSLTCCSAASTSGLPVFLT